MDGLTRWDWVLIVAAGLIAVSALARLMLARQRELLEKFRKDLRQEQQRRQQEEAAKNAKEAKARRPA